MSNKQLDAAARQKGFPNYEIYKAWEAKRTANLRKKGPAQAGAPKNWMQSLGYMHPANLLNYVSDKFGKATGQ